MIVNQNTGQRPDPNTQISHPLQAPATEAAVVPRPFDKDKQPAPQPPVQTALTEAEEKGKVSMKQAFVQGFLAKCAEEGVDPEALIKAAFGEDENPDSRLLAYLSQLLPGIGPALYGWTPETQGRGALKGVAGEVGGGLLGNVVGGAGGAGLGALMSLLSKGRVPMGAGLISGSIAGGIPGMALGAGEGTYRATKKGKKKPAPEKK